MSVFKDSLDTFLAPVKEFLEDDSISEILVNGPSEIFVEQKGILQKTNAKFKDEQALEAAIRNIAQFVGRTIDEDQPMLDARLPDGSRIAAVFPPCSRAGASLSIRKFQKTNPSFVDLISKGTLSKDVARFLDIAVYLGKNIIISGGTGSGKTTLLNVLGSRIPETQRILVVEDSTELKIKTPHVVYFETKPPGPDGKGEVAIRDLLKSALRLRPDRIVVGEVRGGEALDLINAMNTGHGGSMGTVHANSAYDSLIRLETLAMMGNTRVPTSAIRRQIASAVHLVVQISRMSDGSRKVSSVSEVRSDVDHEGRYLVDEIFQYVPLGKGKSGEIIGEFQPTGVIPSFMKEIELNRIPYPKEKFQPVKGKTRAA